MGGKPSTPAPRMRTYSGSGAGPSGAADIAVGGASASSSSRARARSLGSFQTGNSPHTNSLNIPTSNGAARGTSSPDSDSSTPDDMNIAPFGGRGFPQSLPVQLIALQGELSKQLVTSFIPAF